MSELSNLVRQRLASREKPVVHPDPDTLAAYTEQLLEERERNQVLEHLALCGQCREVMVLSLPEQPLPAKGALVTALPSSRRRWRLWSPAFGLAASLASLVIVTAIIIIELPKKPLDEARQKSASQSVPAASAGNTSPAATPTLSGPAPLLEALAVPPAGREESRPGLVTSKRQAVSRAWRVASPGTAAAVPRASESVWLARESRQGYLNSQMFATDANTFNAGVAGIGELPSAPPPRSFGDHVQITPLISTSLPLPALVDTPRQIEGNKAARTFTASASPSSRFGVPFLTALGRDTKQLLQRRTSPAISPNSFVGHAMAGSQFNPATTKQESLEIMAAAPLLERDSAELDQSRAFSARALASPGATASVEKLAAPRFAWKVAGGKLWKSAKAGEWVEGFSADEGIEFSVVRSYGSEVWAGGSNAALAHSRDNGSTWERITLGSSARGTISSIEADGPRVLVKSSSGQSWSSSDDGKIWSLQD